MSAGSIWDRVEDLFIPSVRLRPLASVPFAREWRQSRRCAWFATSLQTRVAPGPAQVNHGYLVQFTVNGRYIGFLRHRLHPTTARRYYPLLQRRKASSISNLIRANGPLADKDSCATPKQSNAVVF